MKLSIFQIDQKIVEKGFPYLYAHLPHLRDSYTASALCYTFTLSRNSSVRDGILDGIWTPIKSGQKYDDWPNSQTSSSPFDWLFDKEKHMSDEEKQKSTGKLQDPVTYFVTGSKYF